MTIAGGFRARIAAARGRDGVVHAFHAGTRLRGAACGAAPETAIAQTVEAGVKPDAILSDFRLANHVTGVEAIAAIRRHFGVDIPAALVTGDTAAEIATLAHEAGLLLLTKPTPPAQLRAVLTRLLLPPAP